jgi:FlaA1/EpsC-like NDP-sugar epimerase
VTRLLDLSSGLVPARSWLVALSRHEKRVLLFANDLALLTLAVWIAFSLRWGRLYWPASFDAHLLFWSAPLIGVGVFQVLGLYRLVTRYLGTRGAMRVLSAVGLGVLLWGLVVLMTVGSGVRDLSFPRSVVFIYATLAIALVWVSREAAGYVLKGGGPRPTLVDRRPVVIWGAGEEGVQLVEALKRSGDYQPVGFLDDSASLIGQSIGGLKVYRPEKLPRLIERDHVKEVLLALPETRRRERREIIKGLAAHPVRVKTMPALADIASGKVAVTDLKPIEVDDLLGRDPVPADAELLQRSITGKAVLVTGAGGSIGSELVRQILRQGPRALLLFEQSEAALYEIETEIQDWLARLPPPSEKPRPLVTSVLGSVLDAVLLERVVRQHGIETIYHAAAYKHVPIVEANPVAGLRNNTFGTAVVATVAARAGVERVTLVSTDKAVRPTNVMGASKRLAELIFQAAAASVAGDGNGTVFTMVRFGNVLDSSGSVVRRFRKQIEEGGPVTVTDRSVIRYFMSIPEAAGLVMQASAMARGGEVFVLDMGEPVKIDDLARTMIRLMGLEVADESNPDGDIAIRYTGLRPGEKLFEELLIDENTTETEHPRIRRNHERFLSARDLTQRLSALEKAMETGQIEAIQAVLSQTVEEYTPKPSQADPHAVGIWATASRTLH